MILLRSLAVNGLAVGRPAVRRARYLRALARVLAALALATALLPARTPPAAAIGSGGPEPFGLTPALSSEGQPRPYFTFTLRAGQTATDTAIISNEGTTTIELGIRAAEGVTAPNSGSAFSDDSRRCTGTACWVTGLPARVRLAPRARRALTFSVHVPTPTPDRQYLAGITAQPLTAGSPVPLGGNGESSVHAVIIHQVSVGVAVTVGNLASLPTHLVIPNVTAGKVGATPRLSVELHNTGKTFARAAGTMTCQVDRKHLSFPFDSNTILPSDRARVPLNAPGLGEGKPADCRLEIRYGPGEREQSTWVGLVNVPSTGKPPIMAHPAPGVYSTTPSSGTPVWAITLIALGGLTLAVLLVILLLLMRRRHQ